MMLLKLLQRMDPSRFSNIVVSLTGRGCLAEEIEALGVPVYSLGMTRARINVTALPKLIRLLRQVRPAILQSWLYHADLLASMATMFTRGSRLIWNLRCSDMDLAHYPLTTRLTLKLLALWSRVPRAIIVNSQVGQRFHETQGYHARRWELIPNGFDVEEFRPDPDAYLDCREQLGLPRDRVLVGMVARVDPMKDHPTFLEAARRVAATRPDVSFLLAGKGVEELSSTIADMGLSQHVHVLGYRKDIAKIMSALDVCTLTSAFGEGFPNVVGEAMACGVPCVVTDVGDSSFVVGDAGKVVPPRMPPALAQAWLDLIELGPEQRYQLGQAARARIQNHFELMSIVHRYQRLYERLTAGTKAERLGHATAAM